MHFIQDFDQNSPGICLSEAKEHPESFQIEYGFHKVLIESKQNLLFVPLREYKRKK